MRHTSVRSAPRAQDRNGVRRRVFPALAIWAALCAGAQADDADLGRDVYGDYVVCPFTPAQEGRMQFVCIASAAALRVRQR